ncbi:mitochondrial ribosome-associated GTPase 2 [Sitodiplosis mosellana]|uniref:mitochondrial ribosome-associated GTPase 2 n=1 Tax=Sitodiplosis mosellana TaxID=263140 RepID=UPI00244498E9|nr:mitochondrial ribosome-associated GTPase 2 [Sitodiplosis mosellana]
MLTIFRRIILIEPNVRICSQLLNTQISLFSTKYTPQAVKRKKSKAKEATRDHFVDLKNVRTIGGRGGDGSISFSQVWCNERAGCDGGDAGNGGHVVFEATNMVNNLSHVKTLIKADDGEDGRNKDRHGKSGGHKIVKVPVGTIVRNPNRKVVGDLDKDGSMFIAARGGAGGKGNHFFVSNNEKAPQVCEYGAHGEDAAYILEIKSMAHLGLIGFPNAGKSTLLRAITRARPKVAPYAFTTLQPHLGIVHYDDYEQVSIADLPGLIPGSHENRGLGIQFLKHAERCSALLFIIDLSCEEPWKHFENLKFEIGMFSEELVKRPQIIVGNKIDVPEALINLESMREIYPDTPIIPISAKMGTNLNDLLTNIRRVYDKYNNNIVVDLDED